MRLAWRGGKQRAFDAPSPDPTWTPSLTIVSFLHYFQPIVFVELNLSQTPKSAAGFSMKLIAKRQFR